MNRIDKKFKELKKTGKKAFVAYITAGDPTKKFTESIILELDKAKVDILELGIPFSDPMADGLTNQKASERALAKGITLAHIIDLVGSIRHKTNMPIVLFTYLNPVFRYGIVEFAKDASASGVDGVLILDLPCEESGEYKKVFDSENVKMIYLIAPTSTKERIKLICKKASGFLYYVSRTGVTGVREKVEKSVKPMVTKIKKNTKLPVVVGFGISKAKQVEEVARYADGVVVGSAIVKRIEENILKKDIVNRVCRFVKSLTRVL